MEEVKDLKRASLCMLNSLCEHRNQTLCTDPPTGTEGSRLRFDILVGNVLFCPETGLSVLFKESISKNCISIGVMEEFKVKLGHSIIQP